MSINECLTLIGVCLFGIMLFVIVISFIFASRYEYDKAKAKKKANEEHIHEVVTKYIREEL